MIQPLLSICIPTYNRCDKLQVTLDGLTKDRAFQDRRVEIIISDNASTDGTEALGRKYDVCYDNIHYYRNDKNNGNENFPVAISRASGKLRKLNNDTFVPEPDALSFMCDLVEKHESDRPVLFFINGKKENVSESLLPFHRFVVEAGYWATWIACFSIWDDECENIAYDTDACDLRLWQVRKVYQLASSKNRCLIVNQKIGEPMPIVKKNLSYGLYEVFYHNYMTLLKPYVDKGLISIDEYEIVRRELLYDFLTTQIIEWELSKDRYSYAKEGNIKEKIFSKYRSTDYWREYKIYYMIKKVRSICSRIIHRW